jgi:hypothetical protein
MEKTFTVRWSRVKRPVAVVHLGPGERSTMKSSWIIVLCVALLSASGFSRPLVAAPQDVPAPADETAAARDAEALEGEAQDKTFENGLYVEVGYGSSDADPMNTSTRTSTSQSSDNSFSLTDMDYGRAAIGWQLPGTKGRFRLVWQGFNETGHEFTAAGRESSLGQNLGGNPPIVQNLDWWRIDVVDGALTAERTPPIWDFPDDTNSDGAVQRDEVRYPTTDITNTLTMEPNLQNRVHMADALYGREFGPRRVEGRWWGGMRYFAYEGTLLQGAWLRSPERGLGYTDGAFIRLLHPRQKTTGVGPTGALGVQVNFFDKRVQMFANGQFAFLISNVETDTGEFFTVTNGNTNDTFLTGVSRLTADRSRTSWHTHLDGGFRFNMKQGLTLEVAYYMNGFLDAVLTATELRVPQSAQELSQGASALYTTQDIVIDGWRGSVGFQF